MSYLLRKKKAAQIEVVQEPLIEPEPEVESPKAAPSNQSKQANEHNEDSNTLAPSLGEDEDGNVTKEEKTSEQKQQSEPEPEPQPENHVHNTSLKNLQLAANGLKDGFVESTLKIFGKDSALEELNLFGNRMTDLSLHRIIAILPDLKKLKSLWIGHNNFTTAGYGALLLTMQNNFVLEVLSIITINTDPEVEEIQSKIDHYCRLNRGGRRIFASDVTELPKSIWPLILEQTNRIRWDVGDDDESKGVSYSADAIFCLLQGPALLDAS